MVCYHQESMLTLSTISAGVVFIALAIISALISANVRQWASAEGHDRYIVRFVKWASSQRKWVWICLVLSGAVFIWSLLPQTILNLANTVLPGSQITTAPNEPFITNYGMVGRFGDTYTARIGHPEDLPANMSSRITVDGKTAMYLDPSKYKLMGVIYHFPEGVDRYDIKGISKSTAYEIRPEPIDILIPYNQNFRNEIAIGEHGSSYGLLAVPIGVAPEQFDTLRQAIALGARILVERGGPP